MSEKARIGIAVLVLVLILAGLPLVVKLRQQSAGGTHDAGSQAVGSERAGVGTTPGAAGEPSASSAEQKVLDRFLGTWSWEATVYTPGSNSEEKHATGRFSFTRVVGGRFVQGTLVDAEMNEVLLLYTYDYQRSCFRYWAFLSGPWGYEGFEAPINGTWNEATRTLDCSGLATEQQPLTAQYHFLSDDAFEYTILVKNPAGQDVYRAEYKLSRVNESQKPEDPNEPTAGSDTPVLGQTAEQKVLDQMLGNWTCEATLRTLGPNPEEKHATEKQSITRILGGTFVQQEAESSLGTSALILYTYDQRRQCHRFWTFTSDWGGPDNPFDGKWNATARTLDWANPVAVEYPLTVQNRFVSDDAFESTVLMKDPAGKIIYDGKYKLTRVKESQK